MDSPKEKCEGSYATGRQMAAQTEYILCPNIKYFY